MHSDIVELAYQLGRQAGVIRNLAINFFISSGSYLQVHFHLKFKPYVQKSSSFDKKKKAHKLN